MSIAEVSKKFSLTADTLRYYEKIGLIPPVARNHAGIRQYSEDDCRLIDFIVCMRQNSAFTLDVLIHYVQLFQQGDETLQARKEILIEQRQLLKEKIDEMTNVLNRLDMKVERYEELILQKENQSSILVT